MRLHDAPYLLGDDIHDDQHECSSLSQRIGCALAALPHSAIRSSRQAWRAPSIEQSGVEADRSGSRDLLRGHRAKGFVRIASTGAQHHPYDVAPTESPRHDLWRRSSTASLPLRYISQKVCKSGCLPGSSESHEGHHRPPDWRSMLLAEDRLYPLPRR